MTVFRRCDRKGCTREAADVGQDVNPVFEHLPIGRGYDVCADDIAAIKRWLDDGEAVLGLPGRTSG